MSLNIEENAIFVADAHFNEKRAEFLIFLEKIKSNEIKTKQLFLMGDMFDFISGESKYFIQINKKVIDILNELSNSLDIIYLEGNHDYNLENLFPNIKVFSRHNQPITAKYKNENVALSHGDLHVNFSYDLYCKIIRNKFLLIFLNLIDFNNWLSKKIYYALLDKNICHELKTFEDIVKKRVKCFDEKTIIEGHFHQGKQYEFDNKKYINIPSITCSKEYSYICDGIIKNKSL